MTRPSVRQNILLRSVQRLLDGDERVRAAAMLSTRHRWFVPYAALAGIAIFAVASVTGVESLLNRVVLAGCALAVAGIATTNYSVLAETTEGLVLCRSSRVRQYAKRPVRRLPAGTTPAMVGSTVITSDWRIEDTTYTTTKRWEATLRRMASGLDDD